MVCLEPPEQELRGPHYEGVEQAGQVGQVAADPESPPHPDILKVLATVPHDVFRIDENGSIVLVPE